MERLSGQSAVREAPIPRTRSSATPARQSLTKPQVTNKLPGLQEGVDGNQTVSQTNKYTGEQNENRYREESIANRKRICKSRTDSPDPTVARLLACHVRQPADQRDGTGDGPAIPGDHRRPGDRRAGPSGGF